MPNETVRPDPSSQIVDVKFVQGTDVNSADSLLPAELVESVESVEALFNLPQQDLDELRPDLKLWRRVTLKPGTDAAAFLSAVAGLENVEVAESAPTVAPPPPDDP